MTETRHIGWLPLLLENGGFKTPVVVRAREQDVALTALTVEDSPSLREGGLGLMHTMGGEHPLVPGENRLGDLVLSQAPLVAEGRILVNGEVPDETLTVRVEHLEGFQTPVGTREMWRTARLSVGYPGGGRFEIRGVAEPGPYRVNRSSSRSYLPLEPIEFAEGATDLLVELQTGGSLEAVVLVEEGIPLEDLWVRLVSGEEGAGSARSQPRVRLDALGRLTPEREGRLYARPETRVDERQSFRWTAVPPGTYRLEIFLRGGRRPVEEIEDVQVIAGQRTRDPRLEAIDIRGRLRPIVVQVLDSRGALLTDPEARPVVVIQDLVIAKGYWPREVSGVLADVDVMLQELPEIRIRVEGGLPDLPDGFALEGSIPSRGSGADHRRIVSQTRAGSLNGFLDPLGETWAFDENGEVVFQVRDDALHGIRLYVRSGGGSRERIEGIEPAALDVRTALSPQVFTVRIPEAGLKQAIERVHARKDGELRESPR